MRLVQTFQNSKLREQEFCSILKILQVVDIATFMNLL